MDYKGKYARPDTDPDGMVDEELLALGVNFTDRTGEEMGLEKKPTQKSRKPRYNLPAAAALVAADGLLIFMCLADKIELGYGLVALAWASAYLGGRVNRARL